MAIRKLGKERMKEIVESDSFVCHKTSSDPNNSKQCAGHLLLLKEKNAYYRLAKLLKIDLNLKGKELVFDTEKDCVLHHE